MKHIRGHLPHKVLPSIHLFCLEEYNKNFFFQVQQTSRRGGNCWWIYNSKGSWHTVPDMCYPQRSKLMARPRNVWSGKVSFCVVFVFGLCLVLNIVCVSGLYILDCHFIYL